MNDFTKDELETFLEWLHHARDSPCWDKYHEEPELITKIQSMIDNHCEHEESHPNHDYEVEQCNKCGVLFI